MRPDFTITAKNQIELGDDDAAIVSLTQGQVAIIDAADIPLVAPYRWCALRTKSGFYAVTHVTDSSGKRPLMYMHRLLMDAPKGLDVDHEDRNGLNNRRSNIRVATRSQNLANKGLSSKNTSGYRGVVYDSRRDRWVASVRVNRKRLYLGGFLAAEEAAIAYDRAARHHFGEFAVLNFPHLPSVDELMKDSA